MNLKSRIELAGQALLGMLDPEKEFMPTGGYEVAHDTGRWWDAVLRVEDAVGFSIPAELEAASLLNLRLLTQNPDCMLMNNPDVPWLAENVRINPHNLRETLLAFGGLVRFRRNSWAREAGMTFIRTLNRCFQPDGRLDFTHLSSWGKVPYSVDPSHTEPVRDGWFDATATSGRALEALVWFYEATREEEALELAQRIAEHHFAHTVRPDGAVRSEILDPENVGHDHSYHGTLRGLLLYGLLTGQREYVDTVEATYRNGVRHRLVKESGWAPHDLGKLRFPNEHGDPVTDPASTGDAAQIALWLALDAGCTDLLDDMERLVRARLLPAQLTEEDARRNPDREFSPREMGAWSIHGLSHAGKGCTPDVLAAVAHTLCDVYGRICSRTQLGVQVNLHFDHDDDTVRIRSTRGEQGTVRVSVTRAETVMIRVPGWVPESSLRLSVNGKDVPVRRMGAFARVAKDVIGAGGEVVMTYDLPERTTEEVMPSGRRYQFGWRGDEIVGIDPQEEAGLPFYPAMNNGA